MRLAVIVCTSLLTLSAFARIVPHKDPLDGVLDAQFVVIVRQSPVKNSKQFTIDEVFLGDARKGDSIDLGDFKLSIERESGPPVVEPISSGTAILLFLQREKDSRTRWEPTYFKESFFWVQGPQETALLRRAAERAVDLREQWESAVSISDPKLRVAGLWPFLSMRMYGVSFFKHTESELQKARPAAGEYFAEQFDQMSTDERMSLLPEAGSYGGEKLHQKLKEHLDQQRRVYEGFVAASGRLPNDVDWNAMPSNMRDVTGEIYYGLAGLARFYDRNDLPLIRETALWSAKYHLEQTADAALDAFRDMPDKANLPTIDRILKTFLPGRQPGMWSVEWDAERALCQHKYPETVPLLAPFVTEDAMTSEAESCLARIVGRDLGRSPKAWIDWYSEVHSSAPTPTITPN